MISSIHASKRRLAGAVLAIFFASLVVTGGAAADEFGRRGAYIGLNGAYAISLFEDELLSLLGLPPGSGSIGNSGGLNTRLGYRAFSWFSIEAQYEWMDSISVTAPGVAGAFQPHSFTGNLKFHIPIQRFQPYLLAGAGVGIVNTSVSTPIVASASSTGFAARAGAGLDVYLTKNWAVTGEFAAVFNTTTFDLSGIGGSPFNQFYYFSVSGGLMYRF